LIYVYFVNLGHCYCDYICIFVHCTRVLRNTFNSNSINKTNSSHVCNAAKYYETFPIGARVVPSSDLKELCTLITTEIRNNLKHILHMSNVNFRLVIFMLIKLEEC